MIRNHPIRVLIDYRSPTLRTARRYRGFSLVALAFALFLPGVMDVAWSAQFSACQKTAQNMLTACRFDAHEEFNKIQANCLNIADDAQSKACLRQARETLKEEKDQCVEKREARLDACELLGEDRYDPDPLLDTGNQFVDPDEIPEVYPVNPYVSLAAGHTYVLREDEDTIVVHVTHEKREIQGVECRVVVDAAFSVETDEEDGDLDYIPVEVTDDWLAQDDRGNVYYCGEQVRNYEDGLLDNVDGSFEAGKSFAKAGVLIRALPEVGEAHRQEFALDEAEDIVVYQALATQPGPDEGGDHPVFPCLPEGCLKTLEINPADPEASEYKYYLPGTGFVLAVAMEDGELTGDREELVCVGGSLDVLKDPGCGIEDPDELLEELCEVSPDAFCDDDGDQG
ncbi:MAG: hypothetical protein H6970_07650 [Gammaproteobacteria bacterium]|nr:hypothetical protein [Gammaproteobacteria bacterium]